MLVDTHAHLYWDSFQADLNQVLQRAQEANLGIIINVGVDLELSQKALEQLEQIERSGITGYSTIGIHPHEAHKYSVDESIHADCEQLEKIYQSNPQKVVGVGECGLDFLFEGEENEQLKDLQIKLFQAQIDLAKKLNLPLVIHVRDDRSKNPENSECWSKAVEMSQDHFGIYHCYSGLPSTTEQILKDTNFLISFAANITYPKNDYLRQAIKEIPLDRIVLETDSPFLSPQSSRGQRNEPSSVLESAQLIAELKGVPLEEVENQTTDNVKKLFKL